VERFQLKPITQSNELIRKLLEQLQKEGYILDFEVNLKNTYVVSNITETLYIKYMGKIKNLHSDVIDNIIKIFHNNIRWKKKIS
jgi:ribosomal protein S8